jgi:hypothetical protein
MSDETDGRAKIACWVAVILLVPIVSLALLYLSVFLENTIWHSHRIESFFNHTPLGDPLRRLAHKISR